MKLGVSTYSFGKYQGTMNMSEIIKKAKEIGFNGIEFAGLGINGFEKELLIDTAKEYKDICCKENMKIMSYTIGADFLNPKSGGSTKDEIKALMDEIDIAKALGADKMRHDISSGIKENIKLLDFFKVLPILADAAREVTIYGESQGIKTMFENHGYFMQNSERCEALIETVAHPNFGSLIDIGNFICADDNPIVAVKRLLPYAFHVHVKDFYVKPFYTLVNNERNWFNSSNGTHLAGSILGKGDTNAKESIKLIVDSNYLGDLSLEFEGSEDNIQGITEGFAFMKEQIK